MRTLAFLAASTLLVSTQTIAQKSVQAPVAPQSNDPNSFAPIYNPPGKILKITNNSGPNASNDPLSSLIAVSFKPTVFRPGGLPQLMRQRTDQLAKGQLPRGVEFPLRNWTDDEVRVLGELKSNVVVRWLDPLTTPATKDSPRFGANCDYVAYFGFGWNYDWNNGVVASAPQFAGHPGLGQIWVNHEYISNSFPTLTSAPNGQALTFAKFLKRIGVLKNDVESDTWTQADLDIFNNATKREYGGSWFATWQDPRTNDWHLIQMDINKRFDSTSSTQARITGYRNRAIDHADDGGDLPMDVVTGLLGDCSGAQTPWGSIITAEENVQGYYGDLETSWTSSQRFIPNSGFDAGANICPNYMVSRSGRLGRITNVTARHNRDNYGFLSEIDVTLSDTDTSEYYGKKSTGNGHRKLGVMGRARWENAAVAHGSDYRLMDGQPVVIYGGNDRRSGRIWRFISKDNYKSGMTKAQVRELLNDGALYVAHFDGLDHATGWTMASTKKAPTEAAPGKGQWIHVSTESKMVAPNAAALGKPGTTVGDALKSKDYNRIGGFPTDNEVKAALFTAAMKLGIKELNRPEDIEWNAKDPSGTPRLYVAFTNHTRQVALDQEGRIYDPAQHASLSPNRGDRLGTIFTMQEEKPGDLRNSMSFDYWMAWRGTQGRGEFDAANPDNLSIDDEGGVWFGTDGNFRTNGTADGVYYLDLDPKHKMGMPGITKPTYGKAMRMIATPSDAEATGPCWNSNQRSIFIAVQHPGEDFRNATSTWPANR